MPRTTLKNIAKHACVGTATVERVLNGRGGVRPEMVEKVLASARKLKYPKQFPDRHRGVTRIEVMMLRPELTFITRLSRAFERIAASLDPSISVHRTFLQENDPQAIAERILNPKTRRSALIVVLPQHLVIQNALAEVQRSGLPVIQVTTRMEGMALDYVGIDNEAAGRMAGLLLSGMQRKPGRVVAICHSQLYGVHRDRVRGFSDFIQKEAAAHLIFHQSAFTNDNEIEMANVVTELIRQLPDLVGLYCAGGDYGRLCDVLRRSRKAKDICLIGHELTEQSAAALRDGTIAAIIDQAPETQARRALDIALHKIGLLETEVENSPIRFITLTAENV